VVALAVVALTISAVTTSILASARVETSARFNRNAQLACEAIQAHVYGIEEDIEKIHMTEETITRDPSGLVPAWKIYSIRSSETGQRIEVSFKTFP